MLYSVERGNVLFASAYHCWGFSLFTFADLIYANLKIEKDELVKYLWGDFYYDYESKEIVSEPPNEKSQPLFVEFILKNIYNIYNLALETKDLTTLQKRATKFTIKLTDSDYKNFEKYPIQLLQVNT